METAGSTVRPDDTATASIEKPALSFPFINRDRSTPWNEMVACYARGRDHSPNHATISFVPTGTEERLVHPPSTEVLG